MADYTIYHNPRCSKSRQTLALLEENGIAPTHAELAELLGVSSTKAAADHLKALAKKGAIRLHSEKTRGIQILAGEVEELDIDEEVEEDLAEIIHKTEER